MLSGKIKTLFLRCILLFWVLTYTSCKKCWECEIQYYKIKYTNGIDYRVIETEGNTAYINSFFEQQAQGYYIDSFEENKIITREYCGTKKEMELDINKNNTTLDKTCYPIK